MRKLGPNTTGDTLTLWSKKYTRVLQIKVWDHQLVLGCILLGLVSQHRLIWFQGVSETNSGMGVIPANTQLQTALFVRPTTEAQKAHVELSISTPNGNYQYFS